MRVAIQGTHGSFSEAAARRRWPDLATLPCREAKDVVAAVRAGEAEAGCLPIENSLIGSVTTTYDLLEEAFGDGTLRLTHEILYPGPPYPHGGARRDAGRHQAGALPPGGAWPVPDLAVGALARRRAGECLGHGRQRGDRRPGGQSRASPPSPPDTRPTPMAWSRWPSASRTIPPTRPASSPSPARSTRPAGRQPRARAATRPRSSC